MSRNRKSAALIASQVRQRQLLSIPLELRVKEQIVVTENGCWEWQGYRYGNGYAGMSWQGKQQLLHRLVYEHFVEAIPSDMQIDHLCRIRHCVNPAHLEVVTPRENTRRAMRTHCVNGHEFTPENTYTPIDGKRYCRACRRKRVRDQRARKVDVA